MGKLAAIPIYELLNDLEMSFSVLHFVILPLQLGVSILTLTKSGKFAYRCMDEV